jgi:hypothetical protein
LFIVSLIAVFIALALVWLVINVVGGTYTAVSLLAVALLYSVHAAKTKAI